MRNLLRKKVVQRSALLPAAALLVGLAGGGALASTSTYHQSIVLKDYQGNPIARPAAGEAANAYSIKTTCFGAVGCHGGTNAPGKAVYTYDQIERHSYHAQLGANEIKGFNPYNPDAYNPYTGAGDKWRAGAGPQGKNWTQSPGHVGSW